VAAAPDKAEEHPSYLASGAVALALMGTLLKRQGVGGPVAAGYAEVEAAINALPAGFAPNLKDALQAGLLKANGDIDALQKSIATWFDDSMDRLSGAYKRQMKWIAMLIGLLVAIAFNADSFNVATTLWNDPERRASTIAIATEAAKKPPFTSSQPVTEKELNEAVTETEKMLRSLPIGWACLAPAPATARAAVAGQAPAVDPAPAAAPAPPAAGAAPATAPVSVMAPGAIKKCLKDLSLPSLAQILGWLLTAAALSLGAPFWFDTLNKFINLRGAGGKPKREDQKV
jgi:hypothetical protein